MTEIRTLPVLPLRDIVVFPHMVVPLFVGREKSVRALEEVMRGEKTIILATQKNSADDDPASSDIFDVGVVATVLQLLKLPDYHIVGTREFEAAEPASSEDAYGGVMAANRAVARLLTDLQGWLTGCTNGATRSSC